MIAATELCQRRLEELLDQRGEALTSECIDEMIERTEVAMRDAIRRIPPGEYRGEAAMDDDGTVFDEPVWVRCRVRVADDQIEIDLSESDEQRSGFVNCVFASTYAGCLQALFMTLDPSLAELLNEGAFAPVTVKARPGLVVSATYPATVGGMAATLNCVVEAVLSALAEALPERAIAPWGRHRGVYIFGDDPRVAERYVRTYLDGNGGSGAVSGFDGDSGLNLLISLGLMSRSNVEEMEIRFPWEVDSLEFQTDSAGAGTYRGGAGYRWVLANAGSRAGIASGQSDGDVMVGRGVQNGASSPRSKTYLVRGENEIPVPSKRLVWSLPGDKLVMFAGGGAGVGLPAARDPLKVLDDVTNELISVSAAREVYSVVIDTSSMQVDLEETSRLRRESAAQR